jgi:dTDP-glucose pyrophosphorylase
MKAVILAAGKGTRMLPLTKNVPKVLVEVNNKPFLYYVLKNFNAAGIKDIALIIGYKKDMFPDFLKKYGFKATLITQNEQLGTGHAAKLAKDFVGTDNFIMCGGDSLFSPADIKRMCKKDNLNYVAGLHSDTPEKFGVLFKDENNKLIKIVEKPKTFIGNLINLGLYKFTSEIFNALQKISVSERGEYELTDALTLLAKEEKVFVTSINDYWIDFGSLKDIPKTKLFLKKNNFN